MPTPKYQIRDALHRVKGPYSESEILQKIAKGKFTGEEEAAEHPFVEWKKLSAYPEFYDAFLNRILKPGGALAQDVGEPKASQGSEQNSERPSEEVAQAATHQQDPFATLMGDIPDLEPAPATEQHQLDQVVDIDKLFQDSASRSRTEPMKAPLHGESNPGIKVEPHFQDATAVVSVDKIPEPALPDYPLSPEPPAPAPKPKSLFAKLPVSEATKKRLPIYLGAILVLGLVLKFQSGEEAAEAPKPVAETKPENGSEVQTNGRLALLVREADDLYLAHTPIAYLKASDELREALAIDSGRLELYIKQAQTLARVLASDPENEKVSTELDGILKRGREIEPENSDFYRAEALRFLAQKKTKEALEAASKALETDPLGSENLLIQAECLLMAGEKGQAEVAIKGVTQGSVELVQAHILASELQLQNQNWDGARKEALKASQLNPLALRSYLNLGESYVGTNSLKEARLWFETAAKLTPWADPKDAAQAHIRAANLAELEGDPINQYYYKAAIVLDEELESSLSGKLKGEKISEEKLTEWQGKTYFDKEYLMHRADEQWQADNYGDAYRYFLGLSLRYPNDVEIFTRLGEARERLAASSADFVAVVETYKQASQLNPNDYRPYLRLGALLTKRFDFDVAYEELSKALKLAPDEAEVYLSIGKHFLSRKDLRMASEYFHTADQIDATSAEISYYQGLVYKLAGESGEREALARFQEAYTRDPQNHDASAEWLKIKVLNGEKMFAVKFLKNLIESDPKNPYLQWVLGEVYATNKEHLRAVTHYHQALDIDNSLSKVRMSLGRALTAVGQLDEAVAEFQLASELDRLNGDGYFEAAGILYDGKRFQAAEEQVKSLLQTMPLYPGARRRLAYIYKGMGEVDKSLAEMRKEVAANPVNYQYAIELAELHIGFQRYEDAIKSLSVVTVLPVDKEVKDIRTPTGMKKIETGYKPLKIKGLLLLSQSQRLLNRADLAEGAITAAVALSSDDPELQKELGLVYHAEQRDREAATAFRNYLQMNPGAPDAAAIKDILEKTLIEE